MIVFISSIFLSILTILGFGKFFQKFFFPKDIFVNIGLIGIFGLFFLSFISYLTHLFFPHNYLHNSIIFIIGLVFFFYFHKKKTN